MRTPSRRTCAVLAIAALAACSSNSPAGGDGAVSDSASSDAGRCGRGVHLALGSASAFLGNTVTVPLTFDARGCDDVSGLQWDLTFAATDFSAATFAIGQSATAAEKMLACNAITPTQVRCLIIGINQTTIASGVIANLTVTLTGTTQTTAPLVLSGFVATSGGASAVPLTGTNGAITVTSE